MEIGDTIGPYHVLAKLGAGGMGEVYRAIRSRPLFRIGDSLGVGFSNRYDASADGSRFLVQISTPQPPPQPPVVIVNWQALTSARVPSLTGEMRR